jgi:ABC-2 type transport system ATP-binding protein
VAIDSPEALKASVGQDRVELKTADDETTMQQLRDIFDLEPTTSEGAVRFYVAGGDRFIPRLFAELTVPILSVSVAQPTLDDVFMSYTGRTIRDAEATASERMAANPFIRRRTGARR